MIIMLYTDHVIMGCCCSLFCTIINSSHNINHIVTWQWHVHQDECTQCLSQSISVWLILLWGKLYVHHQVLHQPLQQRHNEHDGVWTRQPHDCLLKHLFRRGSKKTLQLHVTGLCAGNSLVTSEFPAQMASNAGNVSIWWCHHGCSLFCKIINSSHNINHTATWR